VKGLRLSCEILQTSRVLKISVLFRKHINPQDLRISQPSAQPASFAKLPTELRIQIWRYCIPGPCIIELMWDSKKRRYYSSTEESTILRCCHEARNEILKHYSLLAMEAGVTSPTRRNSALTSTSNAIPYICLAGAPRRVEEGGTSLLMGWCNLKPKCYREIAMVGTRS
jgi:hypothetical protein